MKICICGAGAIGGLIGARLSLAGNAVSAVARGATLEALRRHGWWLEMNGERVASPVDASPEPSALGVQDIVFVAVKGPALPAIAQTMAPLLGRDTMVVPA